MEHIAQGLLVVELLHGQVILVPAAVLPGIEDLTGLLGDFHHVQQVLAAHHHGLLAQHVLAGPHGADGQVLVVVVGGGHQDHVYLVVGQNLLEAVVGVEAQLPGPLLALLLDVVSAGQDHLGLQVGVAGEQFPALGAVGHPQGLAAAGGDSHGMAAAHTAAAHDRNCNFAVDHSSFLSYLLKLKNPFGGGHKIPHHIHTALARKSQGNF